jgi:hypothetical protein
MTTPTATVCQSCRYPITIEYARLGAAAWCPHCLRPTVPEVPVGGSFPPSGYQITYRDFCRLLEDHDSRLAVAPLISDWYGFQIERAGPNTLVRGKDGIPVDRLWLHLEIQADSGRQVELYQVAMSIWR